MVEQHRTEDDGGVEQQEGLAAQDGREPELDQGGCSDDACGRGEVRPPRPVARAEPVGEKPVHCSSIVAEYGSAFSPACRFTLYSEPCGSPWVVATTLPQTEQPFLAPARDPGGADVIHLCGS